MPTTALRPTRPASWPGPPLMGGRAAATMAAVGVAEEMRGAAGGLPDAELILAARSLPAATPSLSALARAAAAAANASAFSISAWAFTAVGANTGSGFGLTGLRIINYSQILSPLTFMAEGANFACCSFLLANASAACTSASLHEGG